MRKLLWLCLLLVTAPLAYSQGSRFDSTAQKTVQNFLAPIPGAQITVCSAAGAGTPCSPTAPIYTDQGLTQLISGSTFTADSNGNFGFWAPPGSYTYSITATGVTGKLFSIVLPINLASSNTFTGSNTFAQQIVSTVSTGTAPFSIASTTVVPNLNAQLHNGKTAPAGNIVGDSDSQVLTSKTLTSPVINGSPTGTGIPTTVYKTGGGGGNYTGTNTTLVAVDTTNLCTTLTVPTGWKLMVTTTGGMEAPTALTTMSVALVDAGATCTSGGVTALTGSQRDFQPNSTTTFTPYMTSFVLNGDGAAHSIALAAKTGNAADGWDINNNTTAVAPNMVFYMFPSN